MWDNNLLQAVLANNRLVAKSLVDQGANPNEGNEWGDTLLCFALRHNMREAALGILSSESFIFKKSHSSSFGLAVAEACYFSALGHTNWPIKPEIIRMILEKPREEGVAIEDYKRKGKSALRIAIESYCSREIIELLVDHGADPNKPNNDGTTPLMYALYARNKEAVWGIINSKAFVFTPKTEPAIAVAIAWTAGGDDSIVPALLVHRAKAALGSPLRQAVKASDVDQVRGLIASGSNVNEIKEGDDHPSLLSLALSKKNDAILSLLINSEKFNRDLTPVVDYLEKDESHFVSPLFAKDQGRLFWLALIQGCKTALRTLLEQGADPNDIIDGMPQWTPLLSAIFFRNMDAALMMVEAPQFVYTKKRGGAALCLAKSLWRIEQNPQHAEQWAKLVSLLTAQKLAFLAFKDDLLRNTSADAQKPVTATTAPLITGGTPVSKLSQEQKLELQKVDDGLWKKGGRYEL